MIHVRRANRVIAALDISIVRGKVERRPTAIVLDIGIRSMRKQKLGQSVMAVLRCYQQRSPAVVRPLVHIGSMLQQDFGALEAIFAGGIDQRRESAAIGLLHSRWRRWNIL